ncbi:MAG: phosphoglycerate mutase, partial [Proteobacteria bacterium]
MEVYLLRHGQKDSVPFADPDLTPFGHQQARQLSDLVRRSEFANGTQFLASPRLRAQSTLRP